MQSEIEPKANHGHGGGQKNGFSPTRLSMNPKPIMGTAAARKTVFFCAALGSGMLDRSTFSSSSSSARRGLRFFSLSADEENPRTRSTTADCWTAGCCRKSELELAARDKFAQEAVLRIRRTAETSMIADRRQCSSGRGKRTSVVQWRPRPSPRLYWVL